MRETRQKTLHYRFAEGFENGRTLQQVLEQVLYQSHAKVKDRAEAVTLDDPEESVRRCITERRSYGDMLFGMLIEYVSGNDKPAVTVDENEEDLELGQVTPPKVEGKTREFVDGSVYFAVRDNHMVVVQSQALQDRHLENHLRWLLISQADTLKRDERLGLRKALTLQSEEIQRVTGVQLGSSLVSEEHQPASQDSSGQDARADGSHDKTTSIRISDVGKGVLESVLGVEWQGLFDSEEYHDLDSLEVTINVRKVGGPRKEGNDAERLMGALTTQLRYVHADDLTVHTKRGPITGNQLFLSEKESVESSHGVPLTDSMYMKMQEWLQSKFQEGVITPE